jgi:hypothetical protein
MSMIDNYRKGWAIRYLREAKAELTAAQNTPPMALSLVLEAMKKAQGAIYYSLGDPASIESIVRQTLQDTQTIEDPVLRCLVEIERAVQQTTQTPGMRRQDAIEKADKLVQIASEIVELLTGEKAS